MGSFLDISGIFSRIRIQNIPVLQVTEKCEYALLEEIIVICSWNDFSDSPRGKFLPFGGLSSHCLITLYALQNLP